MPNKMRGEVTVELFGKTMTMRPTFQSMAEIEGRLGIGCLPLMRMIANEEFGLIHIVVVLTAGLKAMGFPVTEKKVGKAVLEEGFVNYAKPVADFLAIALGAHLERDDDEDERDSDSEESEDVPFGTSEESRAES